MNNGTYDDTYMMKRKLNFLCFRMKEKQLNRYDVGGVAERDPFQ